MAAEFKVSIGADIAGLNSGLNSAENRISSFVSKVNKVGELGDVFQNIGAKLTAGLTLPIIGLGAASIKSFGEIQSFFNKITARKIIDEAYLICGIQPEKIDNKFLQIQLLQKILKIKN